MSNPLTVILAIKSPQPLKYPKTISTSLLELPIPAGPFKAIVAFPALSGSIPAVADMSLDTSSSSLSLESARQSEGVTLVIREPFCSQVAIFESCFIPMSSHTLAVANVRVPRLFNWVLWPAPRTGHFLCRDTLVEGHLI
ncbi:hypothetical protein APHAL10511_004165 [Amanita phalloides]|nr:hypothetical protein APHAL10511_004165 [Amanita phalloides]